MKKYITTLFAGLLLAGTSYIQGQKSYILNQTENVSKTYIARDYIRLLPGFSFKAAAGKTFLASINEHLLESANYQTSSLLPDPCRSLNTGYAVGTTAGEANVTPTGAAVYQIPIYTMPGTGGVQPNVSIGYNSQLGNGLVGYGWNLNAVSAITRTRKNYYHNEGCALPKLDNTDKLILDGQRLSLNYGNNLSPNSWYGTEIETFVDIYCKLLNGYLGFEVKNKEGWTLEYGSSADSYIKPKDATTAYAWLLKKATDANGNYMTYTYDNDAATGEFRLKQIDYTGNDAAGLPPYNKIEFFYETRSDKSTSYIAGKSVGQGVILKRIKCSAYGSTIREYKFNYYFDGCYSKLTEVEEYGQYGMRYNSTIVDWGESPSYNTEYDSFYNISPQLNTNDAIRYTDFNGDGSMDFIAFPLKTSGYTSADKAKLYLGSVSALMTGIHFSPKCELPLIKDFYTLYMGDFNGDSYIDIVRVHGSGSNYEYQIYLFDGNSFTYKSKFTSPGGDAFIGDFNGDGQDEILTKTNPTLYNQSGTSIGSCPFNLNDNIIQPNRSSRRGTGYTISNGTSENFFILDFNGNGKTDIALKADSFIKVYEFSYKSFSLLASVNIGGKTNFENLKFGDFNGDGRTDIIINNS